MDAPAFQCMTCRAPISEERLRERMKNPPGQCDNCGGVAILQADGGERLKEIASEVGVGVMDVDMGRFRWPAS